MWGIERSREVSEGSEQGGANHAIFLDRLHMPVWQAIIMLAGVVTGSIAVGVLWGQIANNSDKINVNSGAIEAFRVTETGTVRELGKIHTALGIANTERGHTNDAVNRILGILEGLSDPLVVIPQAKKVPHSERRRQKDSKSPTQSRASGQILQEDATAAS